VIRSFRHRGLKRLYERDDPRGLAAQQVRRIRIILAALDAARTVGQLRTPAFHLHALKGELKGFWAITVQANWRIIFRFANGEAYDVGLVDYH
jgi:proteic killer suppression protein